MLAKMTSKNQITLPKAVVAQLPPSEYFEVEAVDGRLMLTPVRLQKADAVRAKLAALGIGEDDGKIGVGSKFPRSLFPQGGGSPKRFTHIKATTLLK